MKYNPFTKILYTDDDKVIKKMFCPYINLQWNDLTSIEDSKDRFCEICESNVVETNSMTDDDVFELLQKNPDTCLKIDMDAKNIRMVNHV